MERLQRVFFVASNVIRMIKMNSLFDSEVHVLNKSSQVAHQHVSATKVAASLQKIILKLKGKYLSDDGRTVDYVKLKNDEMFLEFQRWADQLPHTQLTELNTAQRKAFFLNIYNTLTIHGLCKIEPMPKSLLDVSNFWKHTAYNINGLIFSLDDIEHGILRANTRHPSSLSKPFSKDDPRLKFSMEKLDPRIHFALNCGGKSCPAIGVYNEANLDTALDNAAKSFLTEVKVDKNVVHLSKLFLWYGADFGSDDKEILRWVCQFLSDFQTKEIALLIETGSFKIVHDEYIWLINSVN